MGWSEPSRARRTGGARRIECVEESPNSQHGDPGRGEDIDDIARPLEVVVSGEKGIGPTSQRHLDDDVVVRVATQAEIALHRHDLGTGT